METLINGNIVMEIESIEMISGANQYFEVIFSTKNKIKYKIIFDFVCDMRYSIENGYMKRGVEFVHEEQKKSGILLVENSKYIKYFENQVSGTRSMNNIKDYILFDKIDTVVEILTTKEPILIELYS